MSPNLESRFPKDTLEQQAIVPSTEFFLPAEFSDQLVEDEFKESLTTVDSEDAVILTHNDADGMGSGAFMRDWYETVTGENALVHSTSYRSACNPAEALEIIHESDVTPAYVFVTDTGHSMYVDAADVVPELDSELVWVDHHQWRDEDVEALSEHAHAIIDEDRCATKIIADARFDETNSTIPLESDGVSEDYVELGNIVNDLDLWIKEDPRSDDLALFSYYEDTESFMDACLEGTGLFTEFADNLEEYREENNAKIRRGVDAADIITVEMTDNDESAETMTIGFTYGFGPTSDIGNELCTEHDVDLAVIIRPNSSLSFRAPADETGFSQCDELAERFNGGGHPTAAGGTLGLETFEEFVDLWTKEEQAHRDTFLREIGETLEPYDP